MRHIVSISDIHLSQFEPSNGLWMRYRQAPFQPDAELIAMLTALRERVRGQDLTLVLNGDIFDFDVPYIQHGASRFPNAERTEEIAVPVMQGILRDHAPLLRVLARLLADGMTLVFVTGNHDAEMTMPEIRRVLRDALVTAATAEGASNPSERIPKQILFRAWFYLDRDGLLFEHGHQYDDLNCYRTIMHPYELNSPNIAPTFGSLMTRFFSTRLGYFNPNVDATYLLTAAGYVKHWARYYLFSTHAFMFTILRGFTNTLTELLSKRSERKIEQRRLNSALAIQENNVSNRQIIRHLEAGVRPIDEDFRRVIRRLGLDHVAAISVAALCGIAWIHFTEGKMMFGAALAPTIYFGYALALPRKIELDETWNAVQEKTEAVSKIYHARAVVFGHTHHAVGVWKDGVFHGNSGSWASEFYDAECTKPVSTQKPLIWLTRADAASPLTGGLFFWKDGSFIPPSSTTDTPN